MKALKIVGIVVAALLILALAGAAFVASRFDAARIKTEAEKLVLEKTLRTLTIAGDVKLSFWPNLGASIGKVSLSEQRSTQEFAAIDAARISVAIWPLLSGHVIVHDIRLNGLRATLVRRKDGTLNIADLLSSGDAGTSAGSAGSHAGGMPLHLDIAGVNIANATLGWRDERSGVITTISGLELATGRVRADGETRTYRVAKLALAMSGKSESKGGIDNFAIKLEAPELSVTPEKSGGKSVSLSATLTGPQRNVKIKLALFGIESKAQILRVDKLALDLDGKLGEAVVTGRLAGPLLADLGKQTASLEQIDGSLAITDPRMPVKRLKLAFAGALHADLPGHSADGRLTGKLDESTIALKFGVAKFAPLAWNFDVDVDKLDLDRYLPPKKAAAKAADQPAGKHTAGGRFDFSALKGLDLSGALRVGQFQARNIKLSDLRVKLRGANGRLALAPVSAKLYQGTLNGELSLDAKGNAVALRQQLAGIDVGPLLKDAADKDVLEGRGKVALDLSTHGRSMAEMKRALAGSASLALKDGAIKGINLAQSFRDLKSRLGASQDYVVQNKAADRTDFSELSASFRIAGGVAHNDDLSAKSPFLRLSGSGDIDLGASRLNYLLKAAIVASSGGQGSKDLEQLQGLTVPVRLTGPFDRPSWKIEIADLAREAAKARAEELKQKAQERLKDQLKDKLKGLFGK